MSRTILQLLDLKGQTALVTGAACGVGLHMAYALGEAGARIMLTSGHQDELEMAMTELQSAGIDARWVASDTTNAAGINHLLGQTLHRMGDVDILVNQAPQSWESAISLMIGSYLMLSQGIVQKSMLVRRQGCIINVTPLAWSGGKPEMLGTVIQQTAIAGITHLTRALAAEWGGHSITVNAICPRAGADSPGLKLDDDNTGVTPVTREVSDVKGLKGACLLFASEAGKHITGQCLSVDAGNHAVV